MRWSTPLFALLLVAIAIAPAIAAPRPNAADEPGAGGWGVRTPAWLDPGGRSLTFAGGDAPRATPPARAALRRGRGVRRLVGIPARRPSSRRPSLVSLGRRQADGG